MSERKLRYNEVRNRETIQQRRMREARRQARIKAGRIRLLIAMFFMILCCVIIFFVGKSIGEQNKAVAGDIEQTQEPVRKETAAETDNKVTDNKATDNKVTDNKVTGSVPETKKDADTENLLLVNKENPLPEDYQVELVTLNDGVHQCAEEAYLALSNMLKAGVCQGLAFEICSAYRSTDRQQELFEQEVNSYISAGYSYEKAYEKAAKWVMPPGMSEHETGLAFDIVALDYQMLDAGQEDTDENKWLREHCHEYGFILRYPKGKEDITDIDYESWHFRYVGKEAAAKIMQQQITLEEYVGNLREV